MPHFAQAVLTRFNVELGRGEPMNLRWLETRLALMKRYPAESLRLQTEPFDWYCMIHPQTRNVFPAIADKVKALGAQVVLTDTPLVTAGELVAGYYAGKPVILTRLDSDDAIAEDYLETVGVAALQNVRDRGQTAIRCVHGIELAVGRRTARSVKMQSGPVVSLAALNGVDMRYAVDRLYQPDQPTSLEETATIISEEPKWVWARHKFQTGGIPEPAGDWDGLDEYKRFFGFEL